MSIPLLLNPAAGSAAAVRRAAAGDARFAVAETPAAEVADAVRRAILAGHARVAVAGGDGTAGAAAGAAGSRVELAVVPGGTLNHFARSLGIPTDPRDALDLAAGGAARPVDAATVNGRLFVNNSSLGAYVSFVRVRERLERRLGYRLATVAAGVRTLARHPGHRVEMESDGETRFFHTPLVFVGVGERALFPLRIQGRIAAGRAGLHVIVVHTRRTALLLARALAARRAGAESGEFPEVSAFLVDRCILRLPAGSVRVAADGEVFAAGTPLEYAARPGALRVVAPAESSTPPAKAAETDG